MHLLYLYAHFQYLKKLSYFYMLNCSLPSKGGGGYLHSRPSLRQVGLHIENYSATHAPAQVPSDQNKIYFYFDRELFDVV